MTAKTSKAKDQTKRSCAPLRSVKGATDISGKHEEVVEWNGQKSVRTFHIFVNETSQPVELYWFHDTDEQFHGTIQPGSNVYIGTYTFNQWKVKNSNGQMLAVHAGQSATVTVKASGCLIEFNSATADADDRDKQSMDTPKGRYAVRAHAMNMPVWAFDCVPDQAVERAVHIVTCMLQHCPPALIQQMMSHRPALAVFGRDHVVSGTREERGINAERTTASLLQSPAVHTDVPPHSFMRYNVDRNLNDTSRGLGGTPTVPVTSCAEENLTMEDDRLYPCQSILVHELGHAVQNLGMDLAMKERVQAAYTAAVREGLYPDGCYMISNDHEYWATGTEAWFESTLRVDVNGGVNSRNKARTYDPRLAACLAEVYGDGQWRYHHDCPQPLSFYKQKPASKSTVLTTASLSTAGASSSTSATPTHTAQQTVQQTVQQAQQDCGDAQGQGQALARQTAHLQLQGSEAGGGGASGDGASAPAPTASTSATRRLGTRGSAGGVAPGDTNANCTTSATGFEGGRRTENGAGDLPLSRSADNFSMRGVPVDVVLSPPFQVHGLYHGDSPERVTTGHKVATAVSLPLPATPAQGWGLASWSNPLTAFCPGTRMYPSEGREGDVYEPGALPLLSEEGAGVPNNSQMPQQVQQHSSEVIAILSGGALQGADELAAAGAASSNTGPSYGNPEGAGSCVGFPASVFSLCLQGREKKVKRCEKNV